MLSIISLAQSGTSDHNGITEHITSQHVTAHQSTAHATPDSK